ncbi:transformation transcription domain-associated isoform X1 [Labeo rohita]|uniref:Transformation transcription domain-associated isoform X1 n=1 Tax=Labeo rohita TaxID=84645 RepID=A0A498L8T9_LABRO|nr:transformation transcription domain-associated isoform X1 [Labeo rohita]
MPLYSGILSVPAATMSFVPTPSPTVVDQTTLMKKYLQFVAALTDNNTPDETKLKMMQEVSENFENVTSSPQYSTFLEHIIPRFLTFLQDGEVQFLQEKPTQIESEENVLICLRIIIELHKQFRPPISQEIHHFLDFVKQIYKELPKVVARYFENPQVIAENTVPSPEMVGMITSVLVKTAPEREDSETRTHTIIPRGSLSLKVLAELPIIVVLMYQVRAHKNTHSLYKLNIHNVVSEFVPLIMNTIMLQVSPQARQHKLFNKELYADFIAAQIKTLSFLAYIIRIYQDLVGKYSQQMVKGMLQLLSNCPPETAHLRKELLIAAKHILTTDLRSQFIPCMDKLFDESILIGSGYTARETLRPLAYSTLADLVHHVRQNLPLTDLSLAVQLFAKNIDDESLPSSIQTMSCKLLLNLVDCIRSKSEQENGNGRDILMRMLEVFVLKFHTIARYQLVSIFKKCKPQSEMGVVDPGALPGVPATPTVTTPALPPPAPPTPVTPAPPPATPFDRPGDKEDKQTFQVSDCRSLVKTLVCGVKTITWGITSCKAPGEAQFIPNKQLQPKETQIYIKLVKYAMQALDIYQVQIAGNGQTYVRVANCQTVRMKEEKEVLEHFAGVFTMMNPLTFKEIFQTTVPYMVERISKNYALQIVANSFLANLTTSALFATILVEYLLERLPEMGSNVELSNLYLKLFKLVFGSVSLFAAENEQMLKPHLHKIVNSSMELAQSAKEPYNYFLLLRALFRSIGGGSHDLLYQEFLPLLPNLLQGLNMLQSGLHKQHMKDLFVELCLTVPVRLSSLLPYLPMLMDPLVSALNGSQTLVSQGLRTLELCVDNLQPDFLYDHIQPVRAELMQALWRTLRNPAETISHVAYRVLGKFGGSNRKMLKESQKLQYVVTEVQGPSIKAEFTDCKASIQLPMEKAIETALDCLKSANTEPYYRRQAWEVIKCFLVAMTSLEDNKHALYQLLAHPNFTEKWIPNVIISHRYKAQDTPARRTFEQALTGAFMSAVIKDLRPSALPFVASLIRHYTMVAVAQQCGGTLAFPMLVNTNNHCDTFLHSPLQEMRICSAIINLFHLIPAAPQTLVKPLLEVVMKTERAMLIEAGSPFREPLIKFLTRHPSQTVELFMMEATLNDPQWSRMFMSFLKHKDAKPLRDVLASNPNRFVPLLVPAGAAATVRPGSPSTSTARLDLQFQAIKIISIIVKNDEGWLAGQHSLVSQLRRVWVSEAFQERHRKDNMAATNWKEPKLLAYCLLSYCKRNYSEIELLFQLLRAFTGRFLCNMTFLKEYMEEEIPKNYSITHKRALFFRFVEFNDPHFNDELKAKVLQHILNPAFLYSFEKGEGEQLLGPPNPEGDNPESITSVFITKVLDPEKQADLADSLRIYLLQFSTLLVEHAPHHIHDNNKSRNSKLRRLMTFAWPCLLPKTCVDPACKYSGHLLLAHIIAKFAIHKKIVLQVFHSLLKAHTMEARAIVRQAMAILTPAVPARMEDGHQMLTHWTRKIIVEEGHTVPQLVHILHLIVQHFRVYYPVRHHLVQHMISAMQRLGFTPSVTIEQRKLAVDLAEVVIKWELQRIKDQQPESEADPGSVGEGTSGASSAMKRGMSVDSAQDVKRFRTAAGAVGTVFGRSQSMPGTEALLTKPVEKQHTDTVVNFLIRIACQVNDSTNVAGSPGELLSRRCVNLMKTALRPDMWPRAELKLQWFDKLLMTVEQPNQANFSNICTGLEILSFLLSVLQPPAILAHFKPLQRGIAACMTCGNTKVLRAVHSLLSRLMSTFPTEPMASKYEELECLYAAVGKVIYEGLTNYEKASSANPTQLFGTLMILKSACSNNSSYIDRLISVFMRSLQKMVREHLSPQPNPGAAETSTVTSELVMLSLDLVKERLSVMNMEMRKNFIQVILTSLIEKSPDPKILRAVVKIVEEWVKNNSGNPMATNQVPNPREKSILLVKMMTYIEKRFPDDLELNAQFLDLVNYVYSSEFDSVIYASQLLLAVCERNTTIGTSCQGSMLPSITNVINLADSHDRAAFAMATHIKQEPRERENSETKEEDVEIDIELAPGDQTSLPKTKEQAERDTGNQLHMLTNRHDKFLDSLREVKTGALLNALVQLCHISTPLAEKTWVQLFPRLWKILSDRQQHALSGEMGPFLCSGSHQAQRDCQPSALNCFVEAMSQCVPPIPIRPCVLKYLGKTHNLWLRSTLMLEQQAFEKGLSLHIKPKQSTEFYEQESITPPQQEILDSLAELYSLLQEEDMWAGLWQKRCKFPETSTAIAYEQHGFFEQAQETYEKAMEKARKEHNVSPAIFPEYQLWEDHWIRCSKELNQWEPLTEYGQSKGHNNPYLVLECAWRVSNWAAMKEALVQVELSCPKEMAWKVNMHRGYLAICHPEEQQLNFIERLVEMASSLAIREWRRLPHIVSHVHTPLLQAAQQIIELQEAAQINAGLQPANLGRNTSLHDMKTVVKTWRNRLPIVSDDLSHWSSIFMWRQHHYQAIVTAYETNTQHDPNTNNAMLGVHASASAIIQYGKIARKQGLVNVALDILSRIHTIPTVPIVDCFQKIRQQVKCYLQLAGVMGKNECMQGLEVIESTNLKYFTKEMTAEFYALKGMFLAQINKSEEANKAFSAAVQMHDVLVKAWAMWGDYLENIFVKDRQPHLGVSAITCYLHACRHQNESKSRKYLAKVLWLLSFDDKNTLADAVDKYCIGVPPIQWLAWIPQLLTCLVGSEGKPLLNLISQVGRVYPQAVYFPIRTLYLTLKIEQRERYKSDSGQQQPSSAAAQTHSASDPGPIRATAPMWRCSRIMHMQRELHPTLLSSLEGIVDQMVWFRENWHEEVLRQLQQGLAKCYSVAFEKSGAVSDAKITPHTLNFVKKLVSTFGVGLENVSNVSTMFSSAASESLARRAQATAQDPVFQKMKGQFTTDFDFSVPGSMKLHNLISKLKKWIKILEAKTKQLPKFFLIEEKCRFLSNFSAQTAEVEIPGEFLMPKPTHYYIKIARFMPRVEIVQKHNTAARRLYIRGHNGKIYPYLVMNDACLTESRREERVLQLLRLLNPCLEKRKETTKRHLFFTVPRVVAVSPQMRLVEDNPSSLSLVEIYKQRCAKKGIEHDNPISRYYDRLATVQARGTQASHQVLRDILKEVQGNMVPRSMLKEWALHTFPNATDYWTFRKMFTIQLALIGLAEFMLHLNRLNPEMLQIAQDTGKINVSYFRFDINDATGDLDANRPVPFRLTPNISEFLTTIGVSGPLTASMIAVARCFAQPNFKVDGILKAVLRDEIIAWHKKTQEDTSMPLSPAGQPENMDSQQLVSLVQKAVTAIMTRLHNLAQFEGGESKVNTLVAAANSLDNLCRMDPAWHPWL